LLHTLLIEYNVHSLYTRTRPVAKKIASLRNLLNEDFRHYDSRPIYGCRC